MNVLLVLFVTWGLVHGQSEDPIVTTSKGQIRGLRADDGAYSKFLGIPYAVVDEKNPFAPSVPHPGFDEIFEANDGTATCVQRSFGGELTGTIQCLKLHVYVPDTASPQNRLPVMVWIHGGGFVGGSPAHDNPKYLLNKDVIVVSITYRVGVYGFLCLDIPEVPGNQGLKDQVLALRWINENIEAFGGDSGRITTFGVSAGGMSANLHLYSHFEKLFDRAIIQSGPALSYWLIAPSDPNMAKKFAKHLGYNATDTHDALNYLAAADPYTVTTAAYELKFIAGVGRDQSTIKPCIEKEFRGVQSYLTQHPMNRRRSSKVKSSSIIIGHTDNELGFIYNDIPENYDDNNFKESFYLGFKNTPNLDDALEDIRHFYIGEKEINVDVREDIAKYATDIIFGHSTQRMIDQFVRLGTKKVYRYVFSYVGNSNSSGATHGSDGGYIFVRDRDQQTDEDKLLTDRLTTLWTNFAKFGKPTPETSELIPVEWKPVTRNQQFYLDINSKLELGKRPAYARMAFWDVFYKLNANHQMWYEPNSHYRGHRHQAHRENRQ